MQNETAENNFNAFYLNPNISEIFQRVIDIKISETFYRLGTKTWKSTRSRPVFGLAQPHGECSTSAWAGLCRVGRSGRNVCLVLFLAWFFRSKEDTWLFATHT